MIIFLNFQTVSLSIYLILLHLLSKVHVMLSFCFLIVCLVHSHPLASFPVRFQPGRTLRYIYDTEITLNEPGSSQKTPAKKDVGFRFSAEVEVTPVWSNNINLLKLLVRDKFNATLTHECHRL